MRKIFVAEYRFFEDDLARVMEASGSSRKIAAPVFALWAKLERRCALRAMIPLFKALNDHELTESQLCEALAGESCGVRLVYGMRMPVGGSAFLYCDSYAMQMYKILNNNRAALAALAVERYRRRHGALPETLDALVPEFLESVPVSYFDGLPLEYQHGDIDLRLNKKQTTKFNGYRVSGRPQAPYTRASPWRAQAFNVALSSAPMIIMEHEPEPKP